MLKHIKILNATDHLLLIYNLYLFIHIVVTRESIHSWVTLVAFHLALVSFTFLIAFLDSKMNFRSLRWLHVWYPVMLLAFYYPEATTLRHTVFPFDLDDNLISLETALFPSRYYYTIPLMLDVFSLEALHAFYFSYYVIALLLAFFPTKSLSKDAKEFVFVFLYGMCAHYILMIIFPSSGPVELRNDVIPEGFLFIPIMNQIFDTFSSNGGGAFPSTHIVGTLIIVTYLIRVLPKKKLLFYLWTIAIFISTVICCYHYTIDLLSGILTGIISLEIGKRIYASFVARKIGV